MVKRKWLRKQRQIAHALKNTIAHRVVGKRLFDKTLWVPQKRPVAAGVALGLFVAFTPTIPFQTLLAATGALLLKANLPAAVAGVWVTNPLTALPIYVTANRLGRYLLESTWLIESLQELFVPAGRSAAFFNHAMYLWTGSLILSGVCAFLGWAVVQLLWPAAE